jgi:hypothetical protein
VRGDEPEADSRITSGVRRASLLVLLGAQAVQLAYFFPANPQVESDNTRYEEAGFNLAQGKGLSLSYATLPDEDVRSWACSRHPERCTDGDRYPTAGYPPGYRCSLRWCTRPLGGASARSSSFKGSFTCS